MHAVHAVAREDHVADEGAQHLRAEPVSSPLDVGDEQVDAGHALPHASTTASQSG